MKYLKNRLAVAFGLMLLTPQPAAAGPIFEIIGTGSAAPFALSDRFGIVTTGGGGMVGSITFRDDLVLPSSGALDFTQADILQVTYSHQVVPTGGTVISPIFSFTAGQGDLTSAFGQIALSGSDFIINTFNLSIETDLEAALFANIGGGLVGVFQGDYFISGIAAGIRDTTIVLGSELTGVAALTPSSQQPGTWRLTGFSSASVPEPGALASFAAGIVGLIAVRRRWRRLSAA